MAKGNYLRDETRKAEEAQISASLGSQTWTLSFPVNLMETIKAYCNHISGLENWLGNSVGLGWDRRQRGGLRISFVVYTEMLVAWINAVQRGPSAVVMLELIVLGNCWMWRKQQTGMPFSNWIGATFCNKKHGAGYLTGVRLGLRNTEWNACVHAGGSV